MNGPVLSRRMTAVRPFLDRICGPRRAEAREPGDTDTVPLPAAVFIALHLALLVLNYGQRPILDTLAVTGFSRNRLASTRFHQLGPCGGTPPDAGNIGFSPIHAPHAQLPETPWRLRQDFVPQSPTSAGAAGHVRSKWSVRLSTTGMAFFRTTNGKNRVFAFPVSTGPRATN